MEDNKELAIYQQDNIEKKNSDVDKNTEKQHDNSEKMLKLLAEVMVQIIIREVSVAAQDDTPIKAENV
ncbi:hypothetical protein GCM10022216_02620 [Sphingobacterium kyonggiense]|uniref:Uncharacterized protein n=1 Tax=Sphingobacterium kyonggiense TaxID=714075 RepID=A0ABP7Y7G3_9SPHI